MKTDIQIAQEAKIQEIMLIAEKLGITEEQVELYGKYKAKISLDALANKKQDGKMILVTAISPTAAGEGKTTTTVGLADALNKIGKKTVVALREPSLGPVFGVKGGAAGGGYAQVIPMEDLNLHFTGDFHAIGAANNLLAAMLDNHIHQGNSLGIDVRRVVWKRCVDMNDRQLRKIVCGVGGVAQGVPREDGFDITVASEIMAVLCLSESISDLKARLARMIVAYTRERKAITCADLKAEGALTILLKDALKPNLVQTLEGSPAFVHGGPFANIAHGCNSVLASKMGLAYGDYLVTEAGFGADLGAEKFIDIKCRLSKLEPAAVVLVATVRALKLHGGVAFADLKGEDLKAVEAGLANLGRHLDNVKNVFNKTAVVAVNRFPHDTEAELQLVLDYCKAKGVEAFVSEVFTKGSEGAIDLAKSVVKACENTTALNFSYQDEDSISSKIEQIAKKVYHADGVVFTAAAKRQINDLTKLGFGKLPICMAKTQYSFSDQPKLLGAPEGFEITVKQVKVSAGAGFIVALTGAIMTMPGLPRVPAAEQMDISADGIVSGLS